MSHQGSTVSFSKRDPWGIKVQQRGRVICFLRVPLMGVPSSPEEKSTDFLKPKCWLNCWLKGRNSISLVEMTSSPVCKCPARTASDDALRTSPELTAPFPSPFGFPNPASILTPTSPLSLRFADGLGFYQGFDMPGRQKSNQGRPFFDSRFQI